MQTDHKVESAAQFDDDAWFAALLEGVRQQIGTDQLKINTGTADKQTTDFYHALRSQDPLRLAQTIRNESLKVLLSAGLLGFFNELSKRKRLPKRIALHHDATELMLWAEVEDGDEETHDAIVLAASEINLNLHRLGFFIETMVVESRDMCPIPSHYKEVPLPTDGQA